MPTKRFFTRNKEKIHTSVQDRRSIGKRSVNIREKEVKKGNGEVQKIKSTANSKLKLPQLPNIPQTITDTKEKIQTYTMSGFGWQKSIIWGVFLLVGILSLWQGYFVVQNTIRLQSVVSQRLKLSADLALWENITNTYPTYRDAYFQASVLSYRLGEREKEMTLLDKTLQLDPSYLPAQNLEKISE